MELRGCLDRPVDLEEAGWGVDRLVFQNDRGRIDARTGWIGAVRGLRMLTKGLPQRCVQSETSHHRGVTHVRTPQESPQFAYNLP